MLRTRNWAICSLAIDDLSRRAVWSGGNTSTISDLTSRRGILGGRSHLMSRSGSTFCIFGGQNPPSDNQRYVVGAKGGIWRPFLCSQAAGARSARCLSSQSVQEDFMQIHQNPRTCNIFLQDLILLGHRINQFPAPFIEYEELPLGSG